MTTDEDKSLTLLISKMQQKRDDLLMELEKVQKWLTQVEVIISQGKAIVEKAMIEGISPNISQTSAQQVHLEPLEAPEAKAGRILRLIGDKPDTEKNHPEKIRQLFEESGGAMTIQQMDDEFRNRNWPIKSDRRRQIIYNTLVRRNDWFVRLGDKLWGLKGRDDVGAHLDTA
jgi:hypothetical protein